MFEHEAPKVDPQEVLIEESQRERAEQMIDEDPLLCLLDDEGKELFIAEVAKSIAAVEVSLFMAEVGSYCGYASQAFVDEEPTALVVVGTKEEHTVSTDLVVLQKEELGTLPD